ncbi:MAG: type IV secretion system protein [Janthinobacterium lividum]
MGIFTKFETFFTSRLETLLFTYAPIFSGKMALLLQLGATILVLYYGYSIMTPRGSNATMPEMMFNFVRIGLVLAFVQNSGGLLDLSIGFINELKSGFIEEKSLFSLLDEQFLATQKLSQTVFKLDTAMVPVRGGLSSLMVWLGATFMLTSSAIVFIAAEVSLALLTVTSPIFIGCLTYGFTRELFNGWLRSIFSCIITLIFASLVVKIGIDISNEIIHRLMISPSQESSMTIGAAVLVMGIIISSLILVATKLAGNIAGVAATSAMQGGMTLATKLGAAGAGAAAVGTAKYAGKKIGNTASDMIKRRAASFKRLQEENSRSDS